MNLAEDSRKSLASSVVSLEHAVTSSNIKKIVSSLEVRTYSDMLVGYAIIRGIMEYKNCDEAKSYDLLMAELEHTIDSVDELVSRIGTTQFKNSKSVNLFIKRRLEKVRKYVKKNHINDFCANDLHREAHLVLTRINGDSLDAYQEMLKSFGDLVKKELYLEREANLSEETRLSPNYMAEIDAVYKAFHKFTNHSDIK